MIAYVYIKSQKQSLMSQNQCNNSIISWAFVLNRSITSTNIVLHALIKMESLFYPWRIAFS